MKNEKVCLYERLGKGIILTAVGLFSMYFPAQSALNEPKITIPYSKDILVSHLTGEWMEKVEAGKETNNTHELADMWSGSQLKRIADDAVVESFDYLGELAKPYMTKAMHNEWAAAKKKYQSRLIQSLNPKVARLEVLNKRVKLYLPEDYGTFWHGVKRVGLNLAATMIANWTREEGAPPFLYIELSPEEKQQMKEIWNEWKQPLAAVNEEYAGIIADLSNEMDEIAARYNLEFVISSAEE